MHSTDSEDSGLCDDQTNHFLDFGIAPQAQASLLAGPHSSQDIDAATTLASLSDQDVENLKFFAQYCSSFLGDLDEGFDESERISSSPIPIATPVPLPYSARSSEVLESMISGPKETLAHSLTLAEKLEREHAESPDSILKMQDMDTLTKYDSIRPAADDSDQPVPSQAVFRPIRPVSPSTLIALTEPCLMAWSTRLPLSPLPAQVPHSTIPPRKGARIIFAPVMHRNSWGY